MKRSAEEKASGMTGNSWEENVLTWGTAHDMLSLVRHIINDIMQARQRRVQLLAEQQTLDRNRLKLAWRERARRYEVQDEVVAMERNLADARAELDRLGLALLDEVEGEVGFPTLVNDRRAFFTWRPNEDNLEFWQFEGENMRRPVPPAWTKVTESSPRSRR
jgi:hypothetical protein